MKLVIFSGTTEGRELSRLLAAKGAQVTVCVATEYGCEEQGRAPGVTVLTGRKSREEMAAVLGDCRLCVDATHPYAVEVSENIRAACTQAGVPCRRLLRRESRVAEGLYLDSAAQAADWLAGRKGNVLLTTGAKELGAFACLDPARLFPRVLPAAESLAACGAAGIPRRNILAMQGPFSQALNEALIRQFCIAYLVTKDGGAEGGFEEKARAAQAAGARLLVIRRPKETGESFEDIVTTCEELMKCW